MRFFLLVVFAVYLRSASALHADGLLYRLPKDGTWVRYSAKQIIAFPEQGKVEKMTAEGTLTLASVGQATVKGEACRWIEVVTQAKPSTGGGEVKSIFKALIPERHLKTGGSPLMHWIKGWAKFGDQEPQELTKELLSNSAMTLNIIASGPLQDSKPLKRKVIETKLGKLTCEGVSGQLILKGASVSVKNGEVTRRDMKLSVENYFSDKVPFGVAFSRMRAGVDMGEMPATLLEAEFILQAVGTDAKSQLPDRK
jgi:hypothetical protein